MSSIQEFYQSAIKFAALKHRDQKFPGEDNIPYLVHVCDVAMEVMIMASQRYESQFGRDIAEGVLALTKNENLPHAQRMADCLERIKKQRQEVWAVKMADRITNLQPPPKNWNNPRKKEYLEESVLIYNTLKEGNEFLAKRLEMMIENYREFSS